MTAVRTKYAAKLAVTGPGVPGPAGGRGGGAMAGAVPGTLAAWSRQSGQEWPSLCVSLGASRGLTGPPASRAPQRWPTGRPLSARGAPNPTARPLNSAVVIRCPTGTLPHTGGAPRWLAPLVNSSSGPASHSRLLSRGPCSGPSPAVCLWPGSREQTPPVTPSKHCSKSHPCNLTFLCIGV